MTERVPDDPPPETDEVGSLTLFDEADVHEIWREWGGMPTFDQRDLQPWASVMVNFRNPDDLKAFQRLLQQNFPWPSSRSIWYPKLEITRFIDKRYRDASEPAGDDVPGKSKL